MEKSKNVPWVGGERKLPKAKKTEDETVNIIAVTRMQELPVSCLECEFALCSLPAKRDGFTVKKEFAAKRHPNCPLRQV